MVCTNNQIFTNNRSSILSKEDTKIELSKKTGVRRLVFEMQRLQRKILSSDCSISENLKYLFFLKIIHNTLNRGELSFYPEMLPFNINFVT